MKVVVIIPAYNEDRMIGMVVRDVLTHVDGILVVNDGSTDRTEDEARAAGATIFTHLLNRGLGGALATGIAAALSHGADILVTFDADGQHDAGDILALTKPIIEGKADVVLGSRFLRTNTMPLLRRIANWVGNVTTYCLFGVRVSDSQSGLRALSRSAAEALHLTANRMDVSSEIVKEIHEKQLRVVEVPITIRYTSYSLSKGQGFIEGLKTFVRLLLHRFGR